MQWPWRKKIKQTWIRKREDITMRYVPVPSFGENRELWKSTEYLTELCNLSDSRPWISELTELLKEARDFADLAKTPEELKGVNSCIASIKKRLTIKYYAVTVLKGLVMQEKMNSEME